jgi:hypothetical protein
MASYQFERECRTPESEAYTILGDGNEIGRVDIHYGPDVVNATICVPDDYAESDIQDLIGEIDERLVMSANPFREDFVATVWLGRQAGVYSEEFEEEELEEEAEGNGHF